MTRPHPATRLTIIVDENDLWHHRPVYVEIIHRAHTEGLAGATALRGTRGYAELSPIHTTHLFSISNHLPVVIIIVDDRTRIESFLYSLDEVLDKGMVLLDDVEVIRHQPEPGRHGNRSRH